MAGGDNLKDMTGLTFGRLLVIERAPVPATVTTRRRIAYWLCACACGNQTVVAGPDLRRAQTVSCGCYRNERTVETHTKHGMTAHDVITPEIKVLYGAIDRCTNPKSQYYHRYGGRGIKVWPAWVENPALFVAYMGPRPPGTSLDRIDNDGDYAPGNVRWATQRQQLLNREKTVRVFWQGQRTTLVELALWLGLPYKLLCHYYRSKGLPIDEAVEHTRAAVRRRVFRRQMLIAREQAQVPLEFDPA